METRQLYIHFDPRNFSGISNLLDYIKNEFIYGKDICINEFQLETGRLRNNAELHFLKASVTVPIGTKSEFFI